MKNKRKPFMDGKGIVGNTGCIYDEQGKLRMHISAPYSNNGKVFVRIEHAEWGWIWKRTTEKQAKKRHLPIITCCQCDKPATTMDHHWPYMSGMTLCDDHEYDPSKRE